MQAVREIGQAAGQHPGLDRVQVARGRIAAQRPAARSPAFPGGNGQGQFEQGTQAVQVGRHRADRGRREVGVGAVETLCRQRQFKYRGAGVMAEGGGLGIPVKLARPFGIGGEAMLGARMVGAQGVLWGIRHGGCFFLG